MHYNRNFQQNHFPHSPITGNQYPQQMWFDQHHINRRPFPPNYSPYHMPNQMQQPNYPIQPNRPRPGLQGILSHFKTEDGKFDFEKMFYTANQVSSTVKQISPLMQLFSPKK